MRSFDEWWSNNIDQPYRTEYTAAKAAYVAGMEHAAEIAKQWLVDQGTILADWDNKEYCDVIPSEIDDLANAIRKEIS